ncbi:Globin [Trichostrongylus colubriformis]|uniref:Globin n=1 Tax=Trichostrongylus colubriformis TaxID=6319 RepID=A0AAN8FEK0_TRICO
MAVFKKLKKSKDKGAPLPEPEPVKQLDKRVGLENYRDFFTLKNYWKAVDRKRQDSGQMLFSRYLNQNPSHHSLYPKLKNIDPATVDMNCSDTGFETTAAAYLKVFDQVISAIEEKPADVQTACDRLKSIGKMHRTKVSSMQGTAFQALEEPFMYMIKEVLQDRFNDKAEGLFRKFFQFCLKYLVEGFNG